MRCDKTGLMTKWCDLGLELLDSNTSILDAIREGHQNDADKCCTEMFKEWLARKPDASWDELVTSLNNIRMNTAARDVLKISSGTCKLAIYARAQTYFKEAQQFFLHVSHSTFTMDQSMHPQSALNVIKYNTTMNSFICL